METKVLSNKGTCVCQESAIVLYLCLWKSIQPVSDIILPGTGQRTMEVQSSPSLKEIVKLKNNLKCIVNTVCGG